MDDKDLHPGDDYSHRFFIWHEWIQESGHGALTVLRADIDTGAWPTLDGERV